MQVERVAAIPVEMRVRPLGERGGIAPYVTRGHSHERIERTLVRLETADGVTGWGEIRTPLDSRETATALVEDVVAPAVVGHDVGAIDRVESAFDFTYMSIRPVIGGVTMAMWDAHAKRLGVPVYRLFGASEVGTVDVAFCLGIHDPETSRAKAREAHEMGFDVIKTKGGRDWQQDVARMAAMHDEVGDDVEFRLDPNQGWSYDEAVRVGAALEDRGIYLQYMEQPIETSQFGALRQLRSRLRTPIAINEDTYLRGNTFRAVVSDSVDVAVIDHVAAGGFRSARELANVAKAAGISTAHHTGFDLGIKTAANLHFIASTSAVNLAPDSTYYAWADDVIEPQFDCSDGRLCVPEGPGLGITLDESKLARYRLDK